LPEGIWFVKRMGANHVLFTDRLDAALLLATKLGDYHGKSVLVLGLARGGVITASGVASVLAVPYDVLAVKKLASPYNSEFALGAVAPDNVSVVHWKDVHRNGLDEEYVKVHVHRLSDQIKKQLLVYRKGKKPMYIEGKIILLVDDGAATGASMTAAVLWARKKKARKIIVALPVVSKEAAALLTPEVDALVTYHNAKDLESVGAYYGSFPQVTDEEVVALLR